MSSTSAVRMRALLSIWARAHSTTSRSNAVHTEGASASSFFTLSCVNVCRKCYNTDKGVMIMIDKLSDDMKKLFLLGIGAAADTAEKARDMVDHLVEKGEL